MSGTVPAPVEPRLGVMMWSVAKEIWSGRWTVADAFAAVAALGGRQAIEIIGGQLIQGFPLLDRDQEWLFRGLIDAHDLDPVSYCTYVERGRVTGVVASPAETIEMLKVELDIARRLGFRMMRIQAADPDLLDALLPSAERLGVPVVVELHTQTSDQIAELLTFLDQRQTAHLGLLQDFGAFMTRVPEVFVEYGTLVGLDPDLVELVVSGWNHGRPGAEVIAEVAAHDPSPEAAFYAFSCNAVFKRADPQAMRDVLPYLHHVQAKFYGIAEDGTEPAVPYPELLGILATAGYSQVITSEYGGGPYTATFDAFEQLAAHQQMIRRLWPAAAAD